MITEQVTFRDLMYQMTMRDLLLRYKQTVMGVGWAIFMPLVNTAVFSIIFTRVAPIDSAGIPYPVFAYSGLMAWNFFASSLRFSVTSLTSNTTLVTKVYFPREIFPFSAVVVCLVDLAVSSTVLVVLLVYFHLPVGIAAVQLPIVILAQTVFTCGMALLLSMANLFFRDVKYLFEVVITVWMFATSVIYPLTGVGGKLGTALALNPMTPLIDGYRAVLLRNEMLGAPFWVAATGALFVFLTAWVVFHRAEFRFAEAI
jgi:ABC-type polysaccharide/polyol phosphate export permease